MITLNCSDRSNEIKSEGARILKTQGYTKIRYTGRSTAKCEDDDTYGFTFSALSPASNKTVNGTVCAEIEKDASIDVEIKW